MHFDDMLVFCVSSLRCRGLVEQYVIVVFPGRTHLLLMGTSFGLQRDNFVLSLPLNFTKRQYTFYS